MYLMSVVSLILLLNLIGHLSSKQVEPHGPLTNHFVQWMKENNNGNYDYALKTVPLFGDTGSFGGKAYENQTVHHVPVVFIHGNSDSALQHNTDEWSSGWTTHIDYFATHGYTLAELYGITYFDRNISNAFGRDLNCEIFKGHRGFLEAVLEYTGAPKISIIGHSMGVTIARRVTRGGKFSINGKTCELGKSIVDRVDVFLAIAAGNYGMCLCLGFKDTMGCNADNGWYPGTCDGFNSINDCVDETMIPCNSTGYKYATMLQELNEGGQEMKHTVSMWSEDDNVFGKGSMAWGRKTCLVPSSYAKKVYHKHNHFDMKLKTIPDQYKLIKHNFPGRNRRKIHKKWTK